MPDDLENYYRISGNGHHLLEPQETQETTEG
jgi:hypothetical protein